MWKPVYEYRITFLRKFLILFLCVVFFAIVVEGVLVAQVFEETNGFTWGISMLALTGIVIVYIVSSKPRRIRRKLRKNNIEFYDESGPNDMWFVRNNKNLIGLYCPDKRVFVLPANYSNITCKKNYLFIVKDGKSGVVNLAINKEIVPCEYDDISYIEKSGNVLGLKGIKKYVISPYGSIIKEYETSDEINDFIDRIVESVIS